MGSFTTFNPALRSAAVSAGWLSSLRPTASLSVDVDAAAFQHHLRGEYGEFEALAEEGGDGGVLVPIVVLGPGVEAPRGEGDVARDVLDEQGTVVARPDAVGFALEEFHGVQIRAHLVQNAARRGFERRALHQDAHALRAGEF